MGNNLNYMRRRMQLGAQPHKAKASGAVATFRTNLAAKLDSLFVDVTPVQDLHGQAYPYPAGGGKNKLPPMGDASKEANDVTAVRNDDGSISFSGTASASASIVFKEFQLPAGTYLFSNVGSTTSAVNAGFNDYIRDMDNSATLASINLNNTPSTGVSFTLTQTTNVRHYCIVNNGATVSGKLFAMVRLSSESDSTFAPYSNICPITGWAAANVTGTGKNLFDPESTGKEWVDTSRVLGFSNGAKSNRVACSEGMSFTLSQKNASSAQSVMLISFLDKNDKVLSRKVKANGDTVLTDTAPAGAAVCLASFLLWTDTDEQQLEKAATASAYTPYVGTTAVIQFGQTLYGAKIDWKGRRAVVTHKLVTFTGAQSEGWNGNQGNGYFVSASNLGCGVAHTPIGNYVKGIVPGQGSQLHDWEMRLNTQFVNLIVKPPMSVFDTLQKWKGYLDENPLQVLMQLATPVEIPLELVDFVTVPGVNNVFADCGNVDLSYWTNV